MQELAEKYLKAAKHKDIQALDDIFTEDAVYMTGDAVLVFSGEIEV